MECNREATLEKRRLAAAADGEKVTTRPALVAVQIDCGVEVLEDDRIVTVDPRHLSPDEGVEQEVPELVESVGVLRGRLLRGEDLLTQLPLLGS